MSQTTVAKSKSANDNQATRHVVGKATHTVQRLEECPQTSMDDTLNTSSASTCISSVGMGPESTVTAFRSF